MPSKASVQYCIKFILTVYTTNGTLNVICRQTHHAHNVTATKIAHEVTC